MIDRISDMKLAWKLTRADNNSHSSPYYMHLILEVIDRRYNDETILYLKWQSDEDYIEKEPHEVWYGCEVDLPWQGRSSVGGIAVVLKVLKYIMPKEYHDTRSFSHIDPREVIETVQKKRMPRVYHDPRIGYAVEEHELEPNDWETYQSIIHWSGHRVVAQSEASAKIKLMGKANRILTGEEPGYISTTSLEKWVEAGMPVEHKWELDTRAPKVLTIEKMLDISERLQVYA